MSALKGSLVVRAKGALAAGCDIVLHCSGILSEMALISNSVSGFSELGLKRVKWMYDADNAVQSQRDGVDRSSLLEQFEAFMDSLGGT